MKKKHDQLSKEDQKEALRRLFTAASHIKGEKQMEQFLRQLLTDSEQLMMGRRIWIAQLLLEGYTHNEVGERLEAGPRTIHRVSRWLNEKLPGYTDAVRSKGRKPRKGKGARSDRVDPTSFKALRQKYSMHFLLFNLAEEMLSRK